MTSISENPVRESPDEGEQVALDELAAKVRGAQAALLAALREDPARTWTIRALQDHVVNGWSRSVVSIAFMRLLQAKDVTIDTDLRVQSR